MIGDKLLIKPHHKTTADAIFEKIKDQIHTTINAGNKYVISVAGESGSGKSEMGHEIKRALLENGINAEVIGQDSYFVYPPKTNHQMRLKNIEQVGPNEVKLDLMDANMFAFKKLSTEIYKPIVNYDENKIYHEVKNIKEIKVIVIEGTYTTLCEYVDTRIFINRTYKHTMDDRMERGREKFDPFVENVLKIEHEIISSHKNLANIIIAPDFSGIEVIK